MACASLTAVFAFGFLNAYNGYQERVMVLDAHARALDIAARVVTASASGLEFGPVLDASFSQVPGGCFVRIRPLVENHAMSFGVRGKGCPDMCVEIPGVVMLEGKLVPCKISVEVWLV